jgi:hypothetical protein
VRGSQTAGRSWPRSTCSGARWALRIHWELRAARSRSARCARQCGDVTPAVLEHAARRAARAGRRREHARGLCDDADPAASCAARSIRSRAGRERWADSAPLVPERASFAARGPRAPRRRRG